VALVAPGLPAGEADGDTFKVDRLLQAYRQLDHTEVDLVLMPQSSMNGLSPSDPDLRQELLAQVDRQGIPLLAGSELRLPDHRWDRPHQYNAAFLASPPSRLTGTSDIPPPVQWQAKRRPVPWTEFWPEPFRRLPLGGLEQRVAPYIPGNGSTPLKLDTPSGPTSLGVMLCYDAYNPGIASDLQTQGAKLLLVLSSDESFSGSALSRQGLRVARIRGMSLGLPTLRVAWSRAGTGAYDGHGRPLPPRQLQRPVPGVTLWHVPIT
jgi:apolipoprotein N-acyltransferase